MKANGPRIKVTVVYALPDRATEIAVQLAVGATVGDAIEGSGLAVRHREVDFTGSRVGIFGKRADRSSVLADGDRVEVYRSLVADPKEGRLRRAAARPKAPAK
jgi:putative ubiquitin-RnfH superfamily antitoxin RatB of RatAB toxin-antitoxin module